MLRLLHPDTGPSQRRDRKPPPSPVGVEQSCKDGGRFRRPPSLRKLYNLVPLASAGSRLPASYPYTRPARSSSALIGSDKLTRVG